MTTTATEFAVRCRGVTKHYGAGATRVMALRGVDMAVHPGELLMLVGPSGCGKTTLISVIAGILDRDGGECTVFGQDLQALGQGRRTRLRGQQIGFVFQAFNLIPTLTTLVNTAVPLLILGEPRKDALFRAAAMLDRVGLAGHAHKMPAQLSGGQQQRVAIARALIHKPRLLVCDEPTSSLDHETGKKIMELLREVAGEGGRSMIIVTHDNRIYRHADRVATMEDGVILRTLSSPEEIQAL